MPSFQQLLLWALFGLVVGLIAKGIMPGKDPGGPLFTLALGIAGAMLGNFVYFHFTGAERQILDSLSFTGVLLSVGGAFVLLGGYRILFGTARR